MIGGLVGFALQSSLTDSFATGNVSGFEDIGGLVGLNDEASVVSGCYARGNVTGTWRTGGLVGGNFESEIENSYALGDVSGEASVGGLVGGNGSSQISDSYAWGSVMGELSVGSLVGSQAYAAVNRCFALQREALELVGQNDEQWTIDDSTLLPSASFDIQSVFSEAGWDFEDTWVMSPNEARPILQWQE